MTDILTLIGAGGGTVTSATLPLSIANGVLSIDLSSYSDTVAVNTLLANKIDTVTVAAPLTVSGAGASRALTTLWKPSTVSVGAGLFSLASDVNGTRSLSLTGTESRTALKLQDASSVIRDLTSNTSGDLLWDTAKLAVDAAKQDVLALTPLYQAIISPTAMPTRLGAGTWTASTPAGHAIVTFPQQTQTWVGWDHYGTVASLTVGNSYTISLEVMLPASGAVSNLNIGFYDGGAHNPTEILATSLSTSSWTLVSHTSPAAWARQDWYLGCSYLASYPTASLQSAGTLLVKDFQVYSSGGLQWATSLDVTGTFSAASKSFDIVHPDASLQIPGEKEWRLRHWCVESADSAGGLLMYRRTMSMESTTATLEMPTWFKHIAKDVIIQVTPFMHFGSAYGQLLEDGVTIKVHATTVGKWHVLITAARKDPCAVCQCPREIEYKGTNIVPEPPQPKTNPALT